MAPRSEVWRNGTHRQKVLGESGGFKPLHLSFPLAGRLMRIFRPILEVGPNPTRTLVANYICCTVGVPHCNAAKGAHRVFAGEMPAHQSLSRTRLMAIPVSRCCRWVFARPM
jgi:hypothetical protein